MKKSTLPFFILISLFIFSCGKDSSTPTSNDDISYKLSGVVAGKDSVGIGEVSVKITGTGFSATDITDAKGVFAFNKIKSGDYNIKAQKASTVFKPASIDVTVKDSDIDSLNFIVADNYIHGQVIDMITNKGMSDVSVIIKYKSGLKTSTKPDSNGKFEFYDIAENDCQIYISTKNELIQGKSEVSFNFKAAELANFEIIVPTFYLSTEKLQITKATYSAEDSTFSLEWMPSRVNYIDFYIRYYVTIFSTYKGIELPYLTNSISIKKQELDEIIGYSKTYNFSVSALYYPSKNDLDNHLNFIKSPKSETASVQVGN
jgi:hypothetical protein